MRAVHIERKSVAPEAAVELVRNAVRGGGNTWWSAADIAVATGLPLADAEAALLALSTRHPCRIGVGADAALRVRFEAIHDLAAPSGLMQRWHALRGWFARHRDAVLATFTLLLVPLATMMGMAGAFAMAHGAELRADSMGGLHVVPLLFGGLAALFWLFVTLWLMLAMMWVFTAVGMIAMTFFIALTPIIDPTLRETDFSWVGHIVLSVIFGGMFIGMGWAILKPLWRGLKRVLTGAGRAVA
jgi:hypothetical protein